MLTTASCAGLPRRPTVKMRPWSTNSSVSRAGPTANSAVTSCSRGPGRTARQRSTPRARYCCHDRRADTAGATARPHRCRRRHQPWGRAGALCQSEDGGSTPRRDLPQARDPVANRTRQPHRQRVVRRRRVKAMELHAGEFIQLDRAAPALARKRVAPRIRCFPAQRSPCLSDPQRRSAHAGRTQREEL